MAEPKEIKKERLLNKKTAHLNWNIQRRNDRPYERLVYGQPPFSNGDFAFIYYLYR